MLSYQKPIVLLNEDLAEGVYAASGGGGDTSTDCWTVTPVSVQDWSGSHHIFEIRCTHSNTVEHISGATTVTLKFSAPVTDAYSEFPCTFSGSTVTITRTLLADAYNSGDNMTYKVWVKAADEAATKSISCTDATITCKHETNVQGKYD